MPHNSFLGRSGLRRPQLGAVDPAPVTGGGLTLDPGQAPVTGGGLTLDTTTPPPPGAGLPLQAGLQGVPFSSPSLFSQQPTEPPAFGLQGGLRGRSGLRGRRPFRASQLRGGPFPSFFQTPSLL